MEQATTRSSLVKLTFELTEYDYGEEQDEDISLLALGGDANKLALASDTNGLASVGLRDAPLYTDLVAIHKDEMDVLFGAYSRASVEEKRLIEAANAISGDS